MNGWRVQVVQDESTFLRDQIKLFMAYRDEQGLSAVVPLVLEMDEPIPYGAPSVDIQPTVIPRELAEQIHAQLSYVLVNVTDPVAEIVRLRRELNIANHRLDGLISGIANLGGKRED